MELLIVSGIAVGITLIFMSINMMLTHFSLPKFNWDYKLINRARRIRRG